MLFKKKLSRTYRTCLYFVSNGRKMSTFLSFFSNAVRKIKVLEFRFVCCNGYPKYKSFLQNWFYILAPLKISYFQKIMWEQGLQGTQTNGKDVLLPNLPSSVDMRPPFDQLSSPSLDLTQFSTGNLNTCIVCRHYCILNDRNEENKRQKVVQ